MPAAQPSRHPASPWGRWVRCVLALGWLCLLLPGAGAAWAQALPPVYQALPTGLPLSKMWVWSPSGDGVAASSQAAAPMPPTVGDPGWRPIDLPDHWGRSRPGQGGSVWYMAQLDFAQAPPAPWAVYLPRVIMNAEVWVNGVLVGRSGRMSEPYTRNWNTPLLFTTPGNAWRVGRNTLHIRVVALPDNAGGLAPPQVGRADVMAERHGAQRFWQNELVYAANISVVSLGLFVMAVWVRKRERADYGYFSLGAVLWGVANFNMTVREAPFPNAVWELFIYVCTVWSLLSLCLFTLRFARRAPPWLERSVLAYGAACAAFLALSGPTGAVRWGAHWLLPVLALGAWSMWQVAAFVRRTRRADYKILGVVEALALALGLHDWLIQIGYMPFETAYGLPFVAPLLLAALGWLIAGDYARAQHDLATLNRELADRVRDKEQTLREAFDRVASLERAQAIASERHRIMRDMHDGVGMHLSSAIRQLQGGHAGPDVIEQTLRDSLDQLKLTVDSMSLREGDVAGLLGTLRYRLTPRLKAAGLQLHWHVDELPHWPSGHIDNLRHLQYIVFEAVSNALQHAQASELWLRAQSEGATLSLSLEDNGRGCEPLSDGLAMEGKGLKGMRSRARSLGATLAWLPREGGGCRVVLRLPLA